MTYIPNYSNQIIVITPMSPESLGAGFFVQYHTASLNNGWGTANLALYVPFVLRRKITVSKLFTANGTGVAGNIDIGIYSLDGTRITHTGATAQAGTSAIQTINITPVTIGPGQYYMALSSSSASSDFYGAGFSGTGAPSLQSMGIYQQTSAEPLPATATFASSSHTLVPLFGLSGISN
jgi:hypothetical protein